MLSNIFDYRKVRFLLSFLSHKNIRDVILPWVRLLLIICWTLTVNNGVRVCSSGDFLQTLIFSREASLFGLVYFVTYQHGNIGWWVRRSRKVSGPEAHHHGSQNSSVIGKCITRTGVNCKQNVLLIKLTRACITKHLDWMKN